MLDIAARRDEWWDYADRRRHLQAIATLAKALASYLSQLDVLTRDDLVERIDAKEIVALVGSLSVIHEKSTELGEMLQTGGRPRDLAEERWILDVARLYENAFEQKAVVWGSGTGPAKRRGRFFRLLLVSRPGTFAKQGKLTVRQIDRVLKRRRRPGILLS